MHYGAGSGAGSTYSSIADSSSTGSYYPLNAKQLSLEESYKQALERAKRQEEDKEREMREFLQSFKSSSIASTVTTTSSTTSGGNNNNINGTISSPIPQHQYHQSSLLSPSSSSLATAHPPPSSSSVDTKAATTTTHSITPVQPLITNSSSNNNNIGASSSSISAQGYYYQPPPPSAAAVASLAMQQQHSNSSARRAMVGGYEVDLSQHSRIPHEILYTKDREGRRRYSEIQGVFVAFFKGATSESSHFWKNMLNGIITSTGEFTHCELVFRLANGFYVVCTIQWGETVVFEYKEFNYDQWSIVGIRFDNYKQIEDIYDFCLEQRGKSFAPIRVFINFLPFISSVVSWVGLTRNNGSSFFCSELILFALQQGMPGVFGKYEPSCVTPQQLYSILYENNRSLIGLSFLPFGQTVSDADLEV